MAVVEETESSRQLNKTVSDLQESVQELERQMNQSFEGSADPWKRVARAADRVSEAARDLSVIASKVVSEIAELESLEKEAEGCT